MSYTLFIEIGMFSFSLQNHKIKMNKVCFDEITLCIDMLCTWILIPLF